jgi:hypothetical protein
VLTGFDVFAIEVRSVQDLRDLAARCERLGVAYRGVQDNGEWGAYLDIADPDGTVVRFLADNRSPASDSSASKPATTVSSPSPKHRACCLEPKKRRANPFHPPDARSRIMRAARAWPPGSCLVVRESAH